MAAIAARLKSAKSVVALPAFTISRLGLQRELRQAIEALGCPFATTFMEKCIIDGSHPQFAGMYAGAVSAEKTRQIVEGADVVLDLGGVSLNDITTAGYSAQLDLARFISIGLNDMRIGDQVFCNVRLADIVVELAKLGPVGKPYRNTPDRSSAVTGKPSDKITMEALYPRYAAFIRSGDTVVLETGSSSLGMTPMALADDVRVEAQVLWGSIGWATPAAFGMALADPSRRIVLITGEGSHQLTANEIGNMGRFGANIIVFVLNNDGYLIERALEPNPNWTYNDLPPWRYAELPRAMGCADWFTVRVETLGELDAAMKSARDRKSGAYIEVIGGRMDMPPALAFAHGRLSEMYGDAAVTRRHQLDELEGSGQEGAPMVDDVSRRDLLVTSLLTSLPFSLSIAAGSRAPSNPLDRLGGVEGVDDGLDLLRRCGAAAEPQALRSAQVHLRPDDRAHGAAAELFVAVAEAGEDGVDLRLVVGERLLALGRHASAGCDQVDPSGSVIAGLDAAIHGPAGQARG